jgi:hypothetical protein
VYFPWNGILGLYLLLLSVCAGKQNMYGAAYSRQDEIGYLLARGMDRSVGKILNTELNVKQRFSTSNVWVFLWLCRLDTNVNPFWPLHRFETALFI